MVCSKVLFNIFCFVLACTKIFSFCLKNLFFFLFKEFYFVLLSLEKCIRLMIFRKSAEALIFPLIFPSSVWMLTCFSLITCI